MALTFATRKPTRDEWTSGAHNFRATLVTFDNSYPTGGYAITARQLGLPTSADIVVVIPGVASTGHMLFWDSANSKLKAFSAAGTELAGSSAALNTATALVYVIAR